MASVQVGGSACLLLGSVPHSLRPERERLLPYGLFSFASSFRVIRLNPEGMFGPECRAGWGFSYQDIAVPEVILGLGSWASWEHSIFLDDLCKPHSLCHLYFHAPWALQSCRDSRMQQRRTFSALHLGLDILGIVSYFFLLDQSETPPFWFIIGMLRLLNSWVIKLSIVLFCFLILPIAFTLSSGSVCLVNRRYQLSVPFKREGNCAPGEWNDESKDHETRMWWSRSKSQAVLGVSVPSHGSLSAEAHTHKWSTATRAQPRLYVWGSWNFP